jgi:hypothetical protein
MTGSGLKEDLPVHDSLVLFFAGCGCTYYYTTPYQIPFDTQPSPPNSETCQEKVPDARGRWGERMLVQKACIEGNCRIHDIVTVQDCLWIENRGVEVHPDNQSVEEDQNAQLPVVDNETARRYIFLDAFNSRWGMRFMESTDMGLPHDGGTIVSPPGAEFTEEEKGRFESFFHFRAWPSQVVGMPMKCRAGCHLGIENSPS